VPVLLTKTRDCPITGGVVSVRVRSPEAVKVGLVTVVGWEGSIVELAGTERLKVSVVEPNGPVAVTV